MKKILSLVLALIVATATFPIPAIACNDGSAGGGGIRQGGDHNNNLVIIIGLPGIPKEMPKETPKETPKATPAPTPKVKTPKATPTPAPTAKPVDYSSYREQSAAYGSAFMRALVERLSAEGWTVVWTVEVCYTNSYVVGFTAHKDSVAVTGYKILLTRRSTESPYKVSLSAAYHSGWKLADYPQREIIFREAEEADAIEMMAGWLRIRYEKATAATVTAVVKASATGCGCCKNCSCAGNCHPGCGCGCAADLGITAPATDTAAPVTGTNAPAV